MVIVVVAGMVKVPLPASVPPVQVMVVPVRLMEAEPLSVPPPNARVGIDCAAALLSVSVPPEILMGVEMVPENVLVPPCHCVVPAPLMVVAASKVRVSA